MSNLSQNAKANDRAAREKKCANCAKPLGSNAFWTYFIKPRGNTVFCVYCTQENYIAKPENKAAYALCVVASVLIGLAVAIGICLFLLYAGSDTGSLYYGAMILSFVFGLALARYLVRIYQWKAGFVSSDKAHKDYGEF